MTLLQAARRWAGRLWHLVPEPHTRSYVFVMVIVSICTTSGINLIWDSYKTSAARDAADRDAFFESSQAFDGKISNYLAKIEANQSVAGDTTQDIVANLIDQYHIIEQLGRQLNKRDHPLVRDYKAKLVKFRQDLPDSNSILDMRGFIHDYKGIVVEQEMIAQKLPK